MSKGRVKKQDGWRMLAAALEAGGAEKSISFDRETGEMLTTYRILLSEEPVVPASTAPTPTRRKK